MRLAQMMDRGNDPFDRMLEAYKLASDSEDLIKADAINVDTANVDVCLTQEGRRIIDQMRSQVAFCIRMKKAIAHAWGTNDLLGAASGVQTLLDRAIDIGTVDPHFYQVWEVRDQIATLLATRELENRGVVRD